VIVVDNLENLKKYEQNADKLPRVKAYVLFDVTEIPNKKENYYIWKEFLELGASVPNEVIEKKMDKQAPGHCAFLVYTSGTTGNPKGVMLSHDNATWTVLGLSKYARLEYEITDDERSVSYLPLSHIAGFIADVLTPLVEGVCVYYAKPDALQGSLLDTLVWARPTFFLAVPRIWEKIEEKLKDVAAN